MRGDAHWYVQFGPTSTADAWYLIAHAFRCDTPASAIVGQPVTHDVPASGVGNCWQRSDTPATGIVQNWTMDDHAAAGVVAVPMVPHDEAVSGIVGKPLAKDTPAAGVVYEVNADNAIDLRVISVEEAAFLGRPGVHLPMNVSVTVLMGGRPVTDWVDSVTVNQAHSLLLPRLHGDAARLARRRRGGVLGHLRQPRPGEPAQRGPHPRRRRAARSPADGAVGRQTCRW